MAETVRIEIPIETIDETEPGLGKAVQNLKKLETAANNANTSARKANSTVSQFDKNAEKTQRSLASWAKQKYEIALSAKDKIGPLLTTIGGGLKNLVGKTWHVTVKAFDYVTAPLRGVLNIVKNPIFAAGAILGVSIGLKDTIDTYKSFEAAMSGVQAISGATEAQLHQLTAKAKEMGATTKFTAKESADAFNYMAMAGWKTEDMLSGIEGILSLAAASGEELGTTSDIVTDALTAFKLQAKDAGHFSDVLAVAASYSNTSVSGMGETFKYAGSMAGALGYSIEDVAMMTGLMANSGIKGTMSGTALNAMFTRLSTNAGGATDALSDLGIAFFDSNGNANDLSDVIDQLRIKTADMSDEQKTSLTNTVAGMEAQKGLLAILNASEQDYNSLSKAINNADGAAKNMSKTMMNNLQGSITLLQSAVDGVKISFGERLAPYVKGIAEWLTGQMPAIEKGLNEFMDWFDVKADNFKRKLDRIMDTSEWKNSGFFGKMHIAWDEFIANPFKEWWQSAGKTKIADTAGNIGHTIGGAFKAGILTLLGIDVSEAVDDGVSIGTQFAHGFAEGFDFNKISAKLTEGLGNVMKNAMKLLPGGESADLSSLMSAALLMKIGAPMLALGKGTVKAGKAMFGKGGIGQTMMGGSMIGGFLGSAATGSGVLGKSAMLAINLGGGNLAGGASLGTGALAGLGLGAAAGGIAGGTTLVSSAFDLHKSLTTDDKDEASAYGKSAGWKAGGVAGGAAIGAGIGSIVPGVGTAIGALIGGGIGGIAGWIKGNSEKEEYKKRLEEMEKKAEKVQAVYAATRQSVDGAVFSNKRLEEAINDTEMSAEAFAEMFQESCMRKMESGFGNVKLSLNEIKKMAENLTLNGMSDKMNRFQESAETAENTLNDLNSAITTLRKNNWKASLGMNMSEMDQGDYKESIDNFAKQSRKYLEDNHYEATVALDLLTGGKGDTAGLDTMYKGMMSQIDKITEQLKGKVNIALEDGVITLDEAKEIENLQKQIEEITGKIANAKNEASLQSLKIKYTSGAELDYASFAQLQVELKEQIEAAEQNYDSALQLTLTNLNLQLAEGAITQEQYDAAVKQATDGYMAQIDEMNVRIQSFNLETITEAFSSELEGILPNLQGDLKQRISQAMTMALTVKPDPMTWTQQDITSWFNLEGLTAEVQTNVASMLQDTASLVPQTAKQNMLANLGPISNENYQTLLSEWTTAGTNMGTNLNSGVTSVLATGSTLYRTQLQSSLNAATATPYSISPTVNVTPRYNISAMPSIPSMVSSPVISKPYPSNPLSSISKNAAGGYVRGKQLSWLAEEGYGEFVIPTNPSRRDRALQLYMQAGRALGVQEHAVGGYAGGVFDVKANNNLAGINSSMNKDTNAPDGYFEATGPLYDPKSSSVDSISKAGIQVNVNVNPEFNISSGGGGDVQSETDIMAIIRRHMNEIADELGGSIAGKLEDVFSNMPLVEV